MTKHRHTERVLDRLAEAREDINAIRSDVDALRSDVRSLESHAADADESRQAARREIEGLAGDMSESLRRLKAVESARSDLEDEVGGLREKCAALLGENRLLREQLTTREREIRGFEDTARSAERRAEEAEGEAALCRQQAIEARRGVDERASLTEALQKQVTRTADALARSQEALARVTADNVAMIVRTRRAEEEAAALRRDNEALSLALEKQEGPWFEQMRSEVQRKLSGALRRVEEAELAREREREDALEMARVLAEERAEAEGRLQEATVSDPQRIHRVTLVNGRVWLLPSLRHPPYRALYVCLCPERLNLRTGRWSSSDCSPAPG